MLFISVWGNCLLYLTSCHTAHTHRHAKPSLLLATGFSPLSVLNYMAANTFLKSPRRLANSLPLREAQTVRSLTARLLFVTVPIRNLNLIKGCHDKLPPSRYCGYWKKRSNPEENIKKYQTIIKFIKNTIFEVMSNDIYSLNVFSELWACPRAERVCELI